jgi:hypothetical protein
MVVSTRTSAPVAEFASWLRRRRGDLFITQEILADESGLSVRTIRYLESGRTQPRPHTRDAIMVALAHLAGRTNGSINAGTPSPAQLPVDLTAFVDRADAGDKLDRIAEGAGTSCAHGPHGSRHCRSSTTSARRSRTGSGPDFVCPPPDKTA